MFGSAELELSFRCDVAPGSRDKGDSRSAAAEYSQVKGRLCETCQTKIHTDGEQVELWVREPAATPSSNLAGAAGVRDQRRKRAEAHFFAFDLGASLWLPSLPAQRSISSPVKLLWLMMSQRGAVCYRLAHAPTPTPPPTLHTSIFP